MPRLRRLRDPQRHAGLHARARARARADRLRLRHRLRGAVPVLHADVRHALDPRTRARDRDRPRRDAARPLRVGRHRRRRRALDRRKPPHPRAAPQREPEDPPLQQPHLRAHEGPVLADVRAREGHEVDSARIARPSVQPALGGDRRRGVVRRAHDRHRQEGPHGRPRRSGSAPRVGIRRDPPELQHLQRRRFRRRARGRRGTGSTSSTASGSASASRASAASSSTRTARSASSTSPRRGRTRSSSTTSPIRRRASRSPSRGSPGRPTAPFRWASSARSSSPSTTSS